MKYYITSLVIDNVYNALISHTAIVTTEHALPASPKQYLELEPAGRLAARAHHEGAPQQPFHALGVLRGSHRQHVQQGRSELEAEDGNYII